MEYIFFLLKVFLVFSQHSHMRKFAMKSWTIENILEKNIIFLYGFQRLLQTRACESSATSDITRLRALESSRVLEISRVFFKGSISRNGMLKRST
jgi:hypothetical protein